MFKRTDLRTIEAQASAIAFMPEALAREDCVLPVCFEEGCLYVILPDHFEEKSPDLPEKLRFLLNCDVRYDVAEKGSLEIAIDKHYQAHYAEIKNCPPSFQFKCPKQWAQLTPTKNSEVRNCTVCSQDVFLCKNAAELQQRAANHQCVAYYFHDEGFVGMLDFPNRYQDE